VPPDIVGVWLHSHEEDTETTEVYRPADYPFRPARRVRRGLEFRPDGTFIEHGPGPDDRPRGTAGRWQDLEGGRLRITSPSGGGTSFDLTVLSCTNGVLTIAKT
jgi:hypothetical protein